MSKSGFVKTDDLFLGLTRPPMIFGVTYSYVILNVMISMMAFIMTSQFRYLLLSVVFHGIGYTICLKEPLLIELFMMKQVNFRKCKNRVYHGYRNSYDAF